MLSRYETMGAKPKAFIMEGWSIEMFGDSEQARKRREALKACGEFLRSKDVKMLVYMRVGSPIDLKCPGFKDEFLVHADVFKDGGFPALQEATEWRQMNVERLWRHYKKTICVDQWLKAAGMRAWAEGDNATAERCLGLLESTNEGRRPLSIDVDVESATGELEQIRRLACDADLFTAAERARMQIFLDLYSTHTRSEGKKTAA